MKNLCLLSLLFYCCVNAMAQVRLPQIVRDSMILQRDANVDIWGWASANESITVSFNNKQYKTKADDKGNWRVKLSPTPAGGPFVMNIEGKNKIRLSEILMGDVWLCSGQSNMVHQMNIHDVTYADDISSANYPAIRQFLVPTQNNLQGPAKDLPAGHWQAAIADNVRPFSAVAFFFARKLHEKYGVPVGIINSSVGGTPIEAWTSEEGLKDFDNLLKTTERNKDTTYLNAMARRAAENRAGGVRRTEIDKGLSADPPWYAPAYVPQRWRTINIPGYWEDQGVKDLNGVVWYRREIDIPASMTGKAAKVFLGRIVDADELYINGKKIGNTTYQYPQRRYAVAPGVLKAGKNLFAIRVTNNGGKGGFVPDKPYLVYAGADTVDLKGYWQYKVGQVFQPAVGGGNQNINAQNQPTALYNAMIAPITNYTIKGVAWYQGESNAGRPQQYHKQQEALVADWRSKWNLGSFPFLYVQLASFMDVSYLPEESNWAMLREAQLKALSVSNSAMVVAIDLGEWNDIHPDNKKDVGERLALAAQKLSYGEDLVYSGPLYESARVVDGKIEITFSNTGSGLITNDGQAPDVFAIAGEDKKFVWAHAKIEGDKVLVWNDDITDPKYVRYAWADNPHNPNLYNKEGLPASPFRTDK